MPVAHLRLSRLFPYVAAKVPVPVGVIEQAARDASRARASSPLKVGLRKLKP